jgi:hypothetical protein
MVREKRKQREQNKSTTKGLNAFCVLCVFSGQTTCLISVFICVHPEIYNLAGVKMSEIPAVTNGKKQIVRAE